MEQEQLRHNNALQSLQEKFDLDLTNQKKLLVDMQQQRDVARGENETLRLKNKEFGGKYRAFFTHMEAMKSNCLHDLTLTQRGTLLVVLPRDACTCCRLSRCFTCAHGE